MFFSLVNFCEGFPAFPRFKKYSGCQSREGFPVRPRVINFITDKVHECKLEKESSGIWLPVNVETSASQSFNRIHLDDAFQLNYTVISQRRRASPPAWVESGERKV